MDASKIVKLEREYLELLFGEEKKIDDLKSYTEYFVDRMLKERNAIKSLKEKADKYSISSERPYLEEYRMLLITEIRNLKIDKIC